MTTREFPKNFPLPISGAELRFTAATFDHAIEQFACVDKNRSHLAVADMGG